MLAFQMQSAHEDGAECVRVLHISPSANHALHTVTAPALQCYGDDVFEVFRNLLVQPDDFMSRSTEAVFGPVLSEVVEDDRPWADYLIDRYTVLALPDTAAYASPSYSPHSRDSLTGMVQTSGIA